MRKVAHLQVVVVVRAVRDIFNNTNGLYLQVNTLLVIYKSRYYSMNPSFAETFRSKGVLEEKTEMLE